MNPLEKMRGGWCAMPLYEKIVASVAAVLAVVVYYFGQMTFYIDSHTYVMNGYHLLEPMQACHYYWRSIGYPAALYFTGLKWFESFEGILLLQMLAAIAMPWMVYRMLSQLSPRFAFFAALAMCASLLPNLLQNTIYQDQMQTMLGLAVCYYASQLVLGTPQPRSFAKLMVACGLLGLFRPSLLVMYAVPPAFYLYCRYVMPEDAKRLTRVLLFGLAGFAVLHMGHASLYTHVYNQCVAIGKGGVEDHYRRFGKQIFQNSYMYSYDLPNVFSQATGPASMEIYEKVTEYMQTPAMQERLITQQHLPKLRELNDLRMPTSQLGDYILSHPHYDYYWLVFFAPVDDATFARATWEIYWRFPQIAARILWIGWNGLLFGESALQNDHIDMRYLYLVPNFQPAWIILDKNYDLIPPLLADELRGHLHYRYITEDMSKVINAGWSSVFKLVTLVVFGLISYGALLTAVLWFQESFRRKYGRELKFFISCTGLMLMQVLPLVMLVQPQFRYHAESTLLAIPAAAVAAWLGWRIFTHKNHDV